jgi:hypothetical protein
MADNRFFPRFRLRFGTVPATGAGGAAGAAAAAAGAVSSLLPIDRNFYEADVKVTMTYPLTTGNTFELTVAGLSRPLYDAIKADRTTVEITLGYYLGEQATVLEGVVQKKSLKAGDCLYETTLSGVEKAAFLLARTCLKHGDLRYDEHTKLVDLVAAVADKAGVPLRRPSSPAALATTLGRRWSFEERTALDALRDLAERVRDLDGGSLFIRGGQIWFGSATGDLPDTGEVLATEYSWANYLVKSDEITDSRAGTRRACPSERKEPSLGYDVELLADPSLKPGDTVRLRLKDGQQETSQPVTVASVTHDFSREKGYRCTGRVLKTGTFLQDVFSAMLPGAGAVGEEVANLLARNQDRFPSVNVADVTAYTAGNHLVAGKFGLHFEPTVTSPSVEVRLGAEGFQLERRPLVSPFAWNHCGLVAPVYPGMRAAAVHNRYLREDALVTGFLWTEEMKPPPNEAGDWWLCLPVDPPSDRAPDTNVKAANDLTTKDGRRVIQLKGLRLTIGAGLLDNLGSRPQQLGADNELQIEHASGAKITVKDGTIELVAGGRTLKVADGTVAIT